MSKVNQDWTENKYFSSFDGTKLAYRSWTSENSNGRAIILLHRGHEHSGRLSDIAEYFVSSGYSCFAYDSRGHGESPGPRGYCDHFTDLIKDLDIFVEYIKLHYEIKIENTVILANSMGSVVASTWVHDYAPNLRGMILVAPAFKIKLYVPFAMIGLRLLQAIKSPVFITSYVKSGLLTHDKIEQEKYDSDPLITKKIAVNVIIGLFDTAKRIVADAGTIETPTLILSAGSDWVVSQNEQKKFYDKLSSRKKDMVIYPKFFHGLLYEKDRNIPLQKIKGFIEELFETVGDRSELLERDKKGFTKNEYNRLLYGKSFMKQIIYGVIRLMLSTVGRLSKGINIGIGNGFDSGLSLDYVYKNKAEGITFIGKLIDRLYLEAIGWRGIRERKKNLQKVIDVTIAKLLETNQPGKILDIAAGPGRYLIEKSPGLSANNVQILLCDNEEKNLEAGRVMAKKYNRTNVSFRLNDAFDKNGFVKLGFRPNIVIVSGLYELFASNEQVLKSLEGIKSIADENCIIIYTGQPWHPQLEFIASTLTNRLGKQWIMRRRSQAELDYLYEHVGFKKKSMEIDSWGIFTVSSAQLA